MEIKGHNYTIGKLAARQQFHVMRRLAPILASLGTTSIQQAQEGKGLTFEAIAGPVAEALSTMPNEQVDYILDTCLSVVSRTVNGQPALVQAPKTSMLMFPDIDMEVMLKLTMAVIEDNMGDFFTLAQPQQAGGA